MLINTHKVMYSHFLSLNCLNKQYGFSKQYVGYGFARQKTKTRSFTKMIVLYGSKMTWKMWAEKVM